MDNLFKIKEELGVNYLATICKVGELHPIEDSDHLCTTVVNGFTMVVSNDMHEGDIVIYFPLETQICEKFLSVNNLYGISDWEKNANAEEVGFIRSKSDELCKEGKITEGKELYNKAKTMVGFFDKNGRVRIVKLRGVYSQGFVAGINSLTKYLSLNNEVNIADINWSELVGTSFNCVGDDEFCKKYVPKIKEHRGPNGQRNYNKKMNKLKRFDRLVENQFAFHYDTQMLAANIDKFNPDDEVVISLKVHGTSGIFGNLLVNKKLTFFEKIKKFFGCKIEETEYGNIYSSRGVIKNRYINGKVGDGFYSNDVWGAVNELFGKYIPNGMTVYGEIVGYVPGTSSMIQKNHDYGCEVGQWKFMPYRITDTDFLGNKVEWEVADVDDWTRKLVNNHPELEKNTMFLTIFYQGKFKDLYPDIDTEHHWHENVLERMKNDKDLFGMELKEPLCHLYEKEAIAAKAVLEKAKANGEPKKVIKKLTDEYEKYEAMRAPREGIVIRKVGDQFAEAWKLKTNAHYNKEAEQHDSGEVDIEEVESSSENK